MLENLHVKNLALIEEEDITFLDGLHILSGETGAGKSIILGALGLALGGKVSKDMLRDPGKEALVEAVFRITRDSQRKQLAELDIEPYDDEVILSRKITESRSVAKINGEMVPAIRMKEVGDIFLDIHGQNDHQSLLHKKKHLEMLDEYAKNEVGPLKERMQTAYKTYAAKQQEWKEANQLDGDREREISFLEYEIKEITTVVKAYSSAVGAGAFVSEIFGDEADELRRRGGDKGEFGATTGRPRRVGWFDAVASRYGCRIQGSTEVALTVLDVLGYLDEIPICVGYEIDGEVVKDFPVTYKLEKAKPVLKTLPGWKCDIRGIKKYEDLPAECRNYIETIEAELGVPVTMVSNGPGRDEIIMRK